MFATVVQAALVILEDSPLFNTSGMGRGYVGADGTPMIMFTADDHK